ncbi:uncharacterized protein LOC117333425 isoform X2 [Pecten maximus]|nr:uncharacterized protein LOC117333425 isoform X2 [Pecten maximus]
MDPLEEQLHLIASDLNKLSNELEDREKAAAFRIQSMAARLERILGCVRTTGPAPRPANLPTAKRKRHTPVVATNSEDNCSDGSAYGLPAKPCDRESPCHREEPYQTVLRENHLYLMNDLQLDHTQILDKLVEEDVICTANAESLRRIPHRREKTRKLLTQLAGYGPKKFAGFKNALRFSHLHLFDKLEKTESQSKDMLSTEECLACKIARDVDINDVVDKLYRTGVLFREDLENVLQRKSRRESWILIFKCIKYAKDYGLNLLLGCLKHKYPHIAESVRKETDYIKCYCRKASENTEQSLLFISRTASGPYTAIDNHYMSLPHDFSMPRDPSEDMYEKCDDVGECLGFSLYANVNEFGTDLQEPYYENCLLKQGSIEPKDQCHAKENSRLETDGDRRYKRCLSWDNGMYFNSVESIIGVEDPTYIHPCSVDTLSCLTRDQSREHECESPASEDSSESAIVRRGAFRRRCGRESK